MTPEIQEKQGRYRLVDTDTGNPLTDWQNTRWACYAKHKKNKTKQEKKQ